MIKNHVDNNKAAFIIPFYSSGNNRDYVWLSETLESVNKQTDKDWLIFVIDDASSDPDVKNKLLEISKSYESKIELIMLNDNKGPGNARNQGIKAAYEKGCPFILFLDGDDIAHPDRLAVTRKIFNENKDAGVVYSTFSIIDENGNDVCETEILPSINEIIQQHKTAPPQGRGVWIKIATETGYVNLTSSTSVRTELAFKYPFPDERVSEDYYAWLVYSASGWEYVFNADIPAKYRIPRKSASRTRTMLGGQHIFNTIKSVVDVRGFQTAIQLAIENGEIDQSIRKELMIKFCLKKAESMKLDGENEIAFDFLRRAYDIDSDMTEQMIEKM